VKPRERRDSEGRVRDEERRDGREGHSRALDRILSERAKIQRLPWQAKESQRESAEEGRKGRGD
jgi:hypothetical protein